MCKCCQSCLESLYWSCCEERFCWDESIAKYTDDDWDDGKCYSNHNSIVDSEPITKQPNNNNHLHLDENRLVLGELPIHALDIYKVFSKSMIFKDDEEVKKHLENEIDNTDSSKPPYVGRVERVVSFEDEKNEANKMSDFEIMFQDELYADHKMFKIEEEEEEEGKSPEDHGIVMKSPLDSAASPASIDHHHPKAPAEHHKPISRVDSSRSITREDSAKSIHAIPRPKGILLPRSDSARSFVGISRSNSRQDLMMLKRGDSANLDSRTLKNVLARLPQKSASFLSIDDLLDEDAKKQQQTGIYTISSSELGESQMIGKMPDTPVIKGGRLPKFFAETPVIGEYKAETSLRSMAQSPDVIFTETDYSMPRYYGRAKTIANIDVRQTLNSSKSLPDLNAAIASSGAAGHGAGGGAGGHGGEKVSKRLSRLGSRLKPLIIKKSDSSLHL